MSEQKQLFKLKIMVFIQYLSGTVIVILVLGLILGIGTQNSNDDYSISQQDLEAHLHELSIDPAIFHRNLRELDEFTFNGDVANTFDNKYVFHAEGKLRKDNTNIQENLALAKWACPLSIGVWHKNDILQYSASETDREEMKKSEMDKCVVYYVAELQKSLLIKVDNKQTYQSQ